MLSERRASPRFNALECIGMILVDVPSLRTTGLLVDLSEHGLAVQFAVPLPNVATVDVGFPLGRRRVLAKCDAVWSTPDTQTGGLRFRELLYEDRAEIRSCLQGLTATNQLTRDVPATDCEATPSWRDADTTISESWEFGAQLQMDESGSRASDVPAPNDSSHANSAGIEQSITSTANAADALPPIQAGVGSSGYRKSTEPEWATRMAARRPAKLDELRGWREEERGRGLRGTEVAVPKSGLQPGLNDIVRVMAAPSRAPVRHRRYPRGMWLAIVLISIGAGVGAVWQLHRSGDGSARIVNTAASELATTSQGRVAESPQLPPRGIVEVMEGKPLARSNALAKGRPNPITGGASVVRDLPPYDEAARASGLQGDVHAVLTITERGIVQEVRVTQGNSILAKQVINAAAHWRFTPYFDDFGPVSVELPVTFRFRVVTGAAPRS